MTKIIQAMGKKLRSVGVNLWEDPKSPVNLRPFKPGVHGKKKTRVSAYGVMLKEKQKIKLYYDLSEKSIRSTFDLALKKKAVNIFDAFIGSLESKLQMFVFRMKWANSMAGARQLVTHGHILINGHRVNIKSYKVAVNEVVSLSDASREFKSVLSAIEGVRATPEYIQVNNKFEGQFTRIPSFAEAPSSKVLNPKAIVNLMRR